MQYLAKYLVIPVLAAIAAPLSQAALETTREQAWTLRALITELEDTHFVDKRYNDAMSRAHLETYLERLDPSRLYFTQSDVDDFAKFETTLDDLGRQGKLFPAVEIYERYREIASARLRNVIDEMDGVAQRFDFDRDEYIERDPTERSWAETPYGLSERWRKRLKSQVLSLKLAHKEASEIAPTLKKRYENQL